MLRTFARGVDDSMWQAFWNGTQWTWQDLGGQITWSGDRGAGR